VATVLELGSGPLPLHVTLTQDGDFICVIESQDGDWPGTAVISILFNDDDVTTWTATLSTVDATFDVDKIEVNALIDKGPTRARLRYVDGSTDLIWAQGSVSVRSMS